MGRPKSFSREDVLEKAMPVFWKRGFAATSLQDLEQATGVNKSGLYAEFRDKEEIFLECLRHYLGGQPQTCKSDIRQTPDRYRCCQEQK